MIKKFFASFFSFLAVIIASFLFIFTTFYQIFFVETDLIEKIADSSSTYVLEEIFFPDYLGSREELNEEVLEEDAQVPAEVENLDVLRNLIAKEEMADFIKDTYQNFLDSKISSDNQLVVELDFEWLFQKEGEFFEALGRQSFESLPPCDNQVLFRITIPATGDGNCRNLDSDNYDEEVEFNLFVNDLKNDANFDFFTRLREDQTINIQLPELSLTAEEQELTLREIAQIAYERIRTIFGFLLAILIVIITALNFRNLLNLLRAYGHIIFFHGFFVFCSWFTFKYALNSVVKASSSNPIVAGIFESLWLVIKEKPFLLYGISLMLVGGCLFLFAIFKKKKVTENTPSNI